MKPTLYLMVGYPGAGKTTISEIIARKTGATHLWADRVRRERYGEPTYSVAENDDLYSHLNRVTAELLEAGNSVIFDTNFNFRHDRDLLRQIGSTHGAHTVLIWVNTAYEVARHRATVAPPNKAHRILGLMSNADFESNASRLEPPTADEQPIIVDGAVPLSSETLNHIIGAT